MKPINVEKFQRLLIRKWRKAHDKRVKDIRAAAAPAVCVWNPNAKGWWVASCDKRYSFRKSALSKLSECPECNAPIKFTEAK